MFNLREYTKKVGHKCGGYSRPILCGNTLPSFSPEKRNLNQTEWVSLLEEHRREDYIQSKIKEFLESKKALKRENKELWKQIEEEKLKTNMANTDSPTWKRSWQHLRPKSKNQRSVWQKLLHTGLYPKKTFGNNWRNPAVYFHSSYLGLQEKMIRAIQLFMWLQRIQKEERQEKKKEDLIK